MSGIDGVYLNSLTFKENKAGMSGGAIAVHENIKSITEIHIGRENVTNSKTIFEKNEATYNGGAISFNNSYYDNETKGDKGLKEGKETNAYLGDVDFSENIARGVEYTTKSVTYRYNSFGGAIYAKGSLKLMWV